MNHDRKREKIQMASIVPCYVCMVDEKDAKKNRKDKNDARKRLAPIDAHCCCKLSERKVPTWNREEVKSRRTRQKSSAEKRREERTDEQKVESKAF
jgi:hypothetical protein